MILSAPIQNVVLGDAGAYCTSSTEHAFYRYICAGLQVCYLGSRADSDIVCMQAFWEPFLCTLSACHAEKDMLMQTRLQIYVQEENESVSEVHHYHEMPTLPSSLAVCLPCLHGLPDLGVPPTYPTVGPMAAIGGSGTSWSSDCLSSMLLRVGNWRLRRYWII